MKKSRKNHFKGERGITIYIAVTVTAALVLVAFAVIDYALKQVGISSVAKDSQIAFYAADSGIECALYWDLRNTGQSTFGTSTPELDITCNNKSAHIYKINNGSAGTSTFAFDFSTSDTSCVAVTVAKRFVGQNINTKIESRGYNVGTASGSTCTGASTRKVERAIEVTY